MEILSVHMAYVLKVEMGNPKNINKNPVAEKANQELEKELLKVDPQAIRSQLLC